MTLERDYYHQNVYFRSLHLIPYVTMIGHWARKYNDQMYAYPFKKIYPTDQVAYQSTVIFLPWKLLHKTLCYRKRLDSIYQRDRRISTYTSAKALRLGRSRCVARPRRRRSNHTRYWWIIGHRRFEDTRPKKQKIFWDEQSQIWTFWCCEKDHETGGNILPQRLLKRGWLVPSDVCGKHQCSEENVLELLEQS